MRLSRVFRDHRARFLLVGAANTSVGYGSFLVLETLVFGGLPFGYVVSLVMSHTFAIVMAFLLYRRFVFIVVGHWWRDFARFFSVYMVSIGVNIVGLALLVEMLKLETWLGQLVMLIVTTVLSYVGHRWFSFRRGPKDAPLNSPDSLSVPTMEPGR